MVVEQVSNLTKLNWLQCYDLKVSEFLVYATIAKTKIMKHNNEVKKMQSRF